MCSEAVTMDVDTDGADDRKKRSIAAPGSSIHCSFCGIDLSTTRERPFRISDLDIGRGVEISYTFADFCSEDCAACMAYRVETPTIAVAIHDRLVMRAGRQLTERTWMSRTGHAKKDEDEGDHDDDNCRGTDSRTQKRSR